MILLMTFLVYFENTGFNYGSNSSDFSPTPLKESKDLTKYALVSLNTAQFYSGIEFKKGIVDSYKTDQEYLKTNFNCEETNYGMDVKYSKSLSCLILNNNNSRTKYIYFGKSKIFVTTTYSNNNILELYCDFITKSIGSIGYVG